MKALFSAALLAVMPVSTSVEFGKADAAVGRMVVLLANCNCAPTLHIDTSCGPFDYILDAECVVVEIMDGAPNTPKCNAVQGCEQLVNCDAAAGSAIVTYNSGSGFCDLCRGVEVLLGLNSQGTTYSVGVALVVKVGGSAVACTNIDNLEGAGDALVVRCLGGAPTPQCTFTIRDKCNKCPG